MPPTIPVKTADVRKLHSYIVAIGKRTHGDPRIHKTDKIATLKILKMARGILDDWLQLGLFSAEQLAEIPGPPPAPPDATSKP